MNTPPGGAALAAFRLDDTEIVEAGDPGGMLRQIASSAAQVRTTLRVCAEADLSALSPDARPRAIVVVGSGGAGGSGFACDALAAVCGVGSPVQVTGVSGYQLPGWIGAADLVVAVTRSGHTAEALALAGEAARRGCDLVGVGAPDSPLQELVLRARGTFIPVTAAGPARAMPWALTVPLLVAATRLGAARIEDDAYEAAAAVMEDVSHQCRPSSESFVNPAKSLALDLAGLLPMIWGSSPLAGVAAARFAAQLNEDAKYPAVHGTLPEVNHNQVVAFDGPFAPWPAAGPVNYAEEQPRPAVPLRLVILADSQEHPQVTRRRAASAELAAQRGIEVTELAAEGERPLERLASLVQLTDYAAVYLGIASGLDPGPVAVIGDLKDRIA